MATKTQKPSRYAAELKKLGYAFGENEIDGTIWCNGDRLNDGMRAKIINDMAEKGCTTASRVELVYTQLAMENPFHPIRDYLGPLSLSWSGQNHIGELWSYLEADPRYKDMDGTNWAERFFRRWLIGAVAKNYQLTQNFALVLDGIQDIGKSSFARWLCPLPEYFSEAPFKAADNDSRLRKMATWIWEIGELQTTTRKSDREALKHEISELETIARRPYARYDTRRPNITNFIGTINENGSGFLNDPTVSRRFVTIKLAAIDWRGYTANLSPDDIWSQAAALYHAGESWALTPEEKAKQREFNDEYESTSPLEELFFKYFTIDENEDSWLPAIDIITELEAYGLKGLQRSNQMALAELMTREGVARGKPTINGRRAWSYQGVKRLQLVPVGGP